jgi:3-dehydrosphinganine reductase
VRACAIKPDYLFCAAGGSKKENGFLTDLRPEDFQKCFNNNYFSAVFISQVCLRLWLEEDEETQKDRGTRHIVFVSSKAAFVGLPGYSPYTSSKVAVRALADTLRQELLLYGEDRFKVHCAFPGSFMTEAIVAGNVEMPELTKILEGIDGTQEGLLKSKPSSMDMAYWILEDVARGNFMITTDLEGKLLLNNMRGPSPRDNHIWDFLSSWVAVPLWAYYRRLFDRKTLEYGKTMYKNRPGS